MIYCQEQHFKSCKWFFLTTAWFIKAKLPCESWFVTD